MVLVVNRVNIDVLKLITLRFATNHCIKNIIACNPTPVSWDFKGYILIM